MVSEASDVLSASSDTEEAAAEEADTDAAETEADELPAVPQPANAIEAESKKLIAAAKYFFLI